MRYIDPELSMKRAKAGKKGGIATFNKIGFEGMAALGRSGGRPRLKTLEELKQEQAVAQNIKIKEMPYSIKELQRLLSNMTRGAGTDLC